MASRLNEMENEGMIVYGRPVTSEFQSTQEISELAHKLTARGKRLGLDLGLIYCGTTINWPDEFEFTPILIGVVTFSRYGDDDYKHFDDVPASAFERPTLPKKFWAEVEELGVEFDGEAPEFFLAVGGWTWTALHGANGERLEGVSAEDEGYIALDPPALLESAGGGLKIQSSYC